MGILGSLTKIWKKKNKLRSKLSPVSRDIDKMMGWDKIWDLPGGQLKVQPTPSFSFAEDAQNVLRLGNATVGAGGYRALSPNAKANGQNYPGGVIADTLSGQVAAAMPQAPIPMQPAPAVGYPSLGGPRIPTPRQPAVGLASIGTANMAQRRPFTL